MEIEDGIGQLAHWAERELKENILPWWEKHAKDEASGGFYGFIDNLGRGRPSEPRSIVMVSRFLWAHSAAAFQLAAPEYLAFAEYAYSYLKNAFIDPQYGGVFWAVLQNGRPHIQKKQIYGQAFAVYGLSEYALALLKNNNFEFSPKIDIVREQAINIYNLVEANALDTRNGGYMEARAQNWEATENLKLSANDMNCQKSMNTNLHVMEAWTNLLRLEVQAQKRGQAGADSNVQNIARSLKNLIDVTVQHILAGDNHLDLFFDTDWKVLGRDIISYGHDIEASWLLDEALEELGKQPAYRGIRETYLPKVLAIAKTAYEEGFDIESGGYDNEFTAGQRDTNRIWWCQAEAMVGFFNAWQASGEKKYLQAVYALRDWVEKYQKDREQGEWFSTVDRQGVPVSRVYKGGNWKTAYHNGRACLELMRRASHCGH